MVKEHDQILRGNGDRDGLLHSVRGLLEEMRNRKKMQQAILIGVVGLLIERVLTMVGRMM